jgi:cytochrome P450 family 6
MGHGILIGLVITAISLVYFWIRKKYSFFEDNGFLHEEPVFPFGNLKGVGKDFHIIDKVKEYYAKFKGKAPLFGMYFFMSSNVVITDLDLIKRVMIKDFDSFRNRGLYSNVVDDPLTG